MPVALQSLRFTTQSGQRITIQIPPGEAAALIAAITACDPLTWGDYDQVTFSAAPGTQRFRALGTGRNAATDSAVTVPCVELSLFTAASGADLAGLIEAIYHAHPYEEPVIFIAPTTRTLHVRGMDQDNPNRFWNRPTPDWVPPQHRP